MPTEESEALLKAAALVASELIKAANIVKETTLAKASEAVLDRVIRAEANIASLKQWQRWQMATLAAILTAAVGVWLKR